MQYSLNQVHNIIGNSIQIDTIEFIGCGNDSEAFCVNDEAVGALYSDRLCAIIHLHTRKGRKVE